MSRMSIEKILVFWLLLGGIFMIDGGGICDKEGEKRLPRVMRDLIDEGRGYLRKLERIGYSNEKLGYMLEKMEGENFEDSIREIKRKLEDERYLREVEYNTLKNIIVQTAYYLHGMLMYEWYNQLMREGIDLKRIGDDRRILECLKEKKRGGVFWVIEEGVRLVDDCSKYYALMRILYNGNRKNKELGEGLRRLIKGDEYLEFLYDYYYEGSIRDVKEDIKRGRSLCDSSEIMRRISMMGLVYQERIVVLEYYELCKSIMLIINDNYRILYEGGKESDYKELRCKEVRGFIEIVYKSDAVNYWFIDDEDRKREYYNDLVRKILNLK